MEELVVWLAVLALLLGVLALLMEIIVFPGFGVSGLTGILLIAWGVVLLSADVLQSLQGVVIGLTLTVVIFVWAIRFGFKKKFWHKLAMEDRQDQVYSAARPELRDLLGKQGVALTILRPAGAAEIEGRRVDVVTEGGFIMKGSAIVVTRVEGTRVVVKASDSIKE